MLDVRVSAIVLGRSCSKVSKIMHALWVESLIQ